ncbi:MAG TPA: Kazal-type serine protease inhibitor domain-containing protein [Polyangiaceae bacterium]|nr:Kazal-type serine protease inhibitor domain-containing protein [Polyangiaceae bacterium]
MSNIHQSSNRTKNRPWAALFPVLLLAPLAMAPKGCGPVIIGDECPDDTVCTAGAAGGPVGTAGAAGKPTGSGGSAGKPTGSGGSSGSQPSGASCGGLLGLSCSASEYCAYDPEAACGAADQTGICTPKPQACDAILAPVCACDGKTYPSDCDAAMNGGTSVAHTGACQPSSGASCGGLKPASCAKSEYCNFPISTQCGSGDQTGTCTSIPDICPTVAAPVCGCDGVTYSNSCNAASKGVSVLHAGTCDGSTPGGTVCGGLLGLGCAETEFCNFPIATQCGSGDQTGTCTEIPSGGCDKSLIRVCGCDGKTYDNACLARAAGISVASNGACSTACGGRLGATCAKGEYCNYAPDDLCGKADATGICTAIHTGACTANYDPVCGCNDQIYGNACEASLAGVAVAYKGQCRQ